MQQCKNRNQLSDMGCVATVCSTQEGSGAAGAAGGDDVDDAAPLHPWAGRFGRGRAPFGQLPLPDMGAAGASEEEGLLGEREVSDPVDFSLLRGLEHSRGLGQLSQAAREEDAWFGAGRLSQARRPPANPVLLNSVPALQPTLLWRSLQVRSSITEAC